MPREADNIDRTTLSLPELDPLLNPILAQNMSRWAAVYFASAPENREQAVLELLRQLEAEDAAREGITHSPAFIPQHDSAPNASSDSRLAKTQLHFVDCQACGQQNPADNNFCSACGAVLETPAPASGQRFANVPQTEAVLSVENQQSYLSRPAPAMNQPAITPRESSRVPPDHKFRSSNHTQHLRRYSQPASHSYRVYILAAVAILAPALLFIAWRSRQTVPESSPAAAQVPPAIPSTTPSITTEQPAAPAPTASTPGETTSKADPPEQTRSSDSAPVISSHAAEKLSGKAISDNGSEELAIAMSFLNVTGGKQRNSEEAVQWLWRAVAKRNTDATLRLSDLYLRGDGIAKNCDQARVLLDAAAIRGSSGAAERLRHLPSFGCQ